MLRTSRRTVAALAALCTLAALSFMGHLYGQRAPGKVLVPPVGPGGAKAPGVPTKPAGFDLGNLTLSNDDRLGEKVQFAVERIKDKDWTRACNTLMDLIVRQDDVFIPVTRATPEGGESTVYVSVKKEAQRLISTMPKPGRDFYETNFGPRAREMVNQARTNNDFVQMATAMNLYLYTESGAEAASWLGTWMLDRAEFQGAARFFGILIGRNGIEALKQGQLLKAAYAFHHAGDVPNKEFVFKELMRRDVEVRLRGEPLSATEVRTGIDKMLTRVSIQSASDSPVYRGRPSRTAMLPGGAPFLENTWKRDDMIRSDSVKTFIENAETGLKSRNKNAYGAFVPVTATMTRGDKKVPLIIYRSFGGINVVDMKSGKLVWASPSDWGLDTVLGATGKEKNSEKISAYQGWMSNWGNSQRGEILLENTVLSTLSADSRNVYAVEDLAFPPPFSAVNAAMMGGMPGNSMGKDVLDAVNMNRLIAYDLTKEGKMAWEIGGKDDLTLADTFFLSAPLPLNGQLFVLTEKMQELSLLTLNPATGKVVRKQDLATVKNLKVSQDPYRRIQAAHLAYGEGILVVPTNAGAVFGIDTLGNSLVWAYPYRKAVEAAPAVGPGVMPGGGFGGGRVGIPAPGPGWVMGPGGNYIKTDTGWQVTAPAVAEGKVVFTAPDEGDIHCVNLRDGSRSWVVPRRPDDLYLAGVYSGKAVVVGKTRTRAISLARGETMWELDTGSPSGQGAAGAPNAEGHVIYYLPIRESVATREPEICAINVDKGIIHAHTRSRKKEIPGNLLFYEGNVLSQTYREVVAYPQLEIKLAEMDRLVKDDPNNPDALTDRGDYLLDKGDLGGAIADFRLALKNGPKPETKLKARTKLFEAFTEYFQRDFVKAEGFLKEYEEMCKIDLTDLKGEDVSKAEAEMRRRRANFLCLVGKGRETQGNLVEAFERYLELGTEAHKDELIQVVDEPSVKSAPDVWAQGRIAAMIATAGNAEQKKAIEGLITDRWNRIRNARSPEDIRRFVNLFGSLFGVGKDARMTLAERLMDDTDINSILEAEQQLSLLRSDRVEQVAARAIEGLARLNTRKGMMEDAAYYYRLLGEKYPKIIVNGKTGADYLDDLATDKRFLPYLDQSARFVMKKGDLRSRPEKATGTAQTIYQFGQLGEQLPFFANNKLGLSLDWSHQLRLTDVNSGEVRWQLRLTPTQFQQIVAGTGSNNKVKFSFQSLGHLVVLQMGHMVFAIDPLGKGRVLWERNLSSLPGGAYTPNSTTTDAKDDAVVLGYTDGWTQRLGVGGPLQGGVVTLQRRDSLTAIDPVSGRDLWTRTDINSRSRVFGDDEHVYVVGMGDDDKPAGTRVFRAYDGVNVRAVDFSAVYQARLRISGRTILASEADAKNGLVLRLYDVVDGKDIWREKFEQGTTLLASEDPKLVGVLDKALNVRVFDVDQRREVFTSKIVERAHVENATSIHLIADPDYIFLATNKPDPNVNGGIQANVMPGSGLRAVPINGWMYAFKRKTNAVHWYYPVENEQLILSQFEDLPLVLFTSRLMHRPAGPAFGGNFVWKYQGFGRAKHNGKMCYEDNSLPQGMYFNSLTMDHRSGKVEFAGPGHKVVIAPEAVVAAAEKK